MRINIDNLFYGGSEESTEQLIENLRSEGYAASGAMVDRVPGLDINVDKRSGQQGEAEPGACFFPFWEMRENRHLIESRDFSTILAKRPDDWTPSIRGQVLPEPI